MAKRRRLAKAQRGRARALHLAGWLWLLVVALAFGFLWQAFGTGEGALASANWVRAAAFFMAAIGAGPILLYLTIERTGLLSSQTDNDGQRRVSETSAGAVQMLGHGKAAVRQGSIRTLQSLALDNPGEHAKTMDILAAYLRDGSVIHVDDTTALLQRARRGGEANEAAFLAAVRLVQRAARALPEGSERRLALEDMMERVQGWGEAGVTAVREVEPDEITGLLLPALPMPIDLQAAVAAICAGLPRRDAGEVQDEREIPDGRQALDLSGSHLYKADLEETELRGADLSNTGLYECSLRRANLLGALLGGASVRNTNLDEVVLETADMPGADLRGSSLFLTNLQRAHMHRANLEGAVLRGTDLRDARMARAALQGAVLHGCQLQRAILHEADLRRALLLRTQLQAANLKRANLSHARLEGSDLAQANLQSARLRGADLRGTVNLTQGQVDQAMGDANTMLPEGLHPPSHWAGSARP